MEHKERSLEYTRIIKNPKILAPSFVSLRLSEFEVCEVVTKITFGFIFLKINQFHFLHQSHQEVISQLYFP